MPRTKTSIIEKRYKTKDGQVRTLQIDYAKVVDRLNEFRSAHPNSKIAVKEAYDEDGNLTCHAYIWRDKTDFLDLLKCGIAATEAMESADAEGSSLMPANRVAAEKGHEKNETIAIGRALAVLGYAASGEIASSEEMEEFEIFKKEKAEEAQIEAIKKLGDAKDIDTLFEAWKSLTKEQQLDPDVQAKKNELKKEFTK